MTCLAVGMPAVCAEKSKNAKVVSAKNSAASGSAGRARKAVTAKKGGAKTKARSKAAPGSMERTRRLLLAALRVWELKRRPLE